MRWPRASARRSNSYCGFGHKRKRAARELQLIDVIPPLVRTSLRGNAVLRPSNTVRGSPLSRVSLVWFRVDLFAEKERCGQAASISFLSSKERNASGERLSGERTRLGCWRARPRDRKLFFNFATKSVEAVIKVRFGKMPKPARWKRALPGDSRTPIACLDSIG